MLTRRLWIALALCASLSASGCLFLAAGAATGAAVTYYYLKGRVCSNFPSTYADTWAATTTALTELSLPILKTTQQGSKGSLRSRLPDGTEIHIDLDSDLTSRDGVSTSVCIRVGSFGDRIESVRILDQISSHLGTPIPMVPQLPPQVPAMAPATAPPVGAAPSETVPPPSLPPAPVPVQR